jgi:hypothetical protein
MAGPADVGTDCHDRCQTQSGPGRWGEATEGQGEGYAGSGGGETQNVPRSLRLCWPLGRDRTSGRGAGVRRG